MFAALLKPHLPRGYLISRSRCNILVVRTMEALATSNPNIPKEAPMSTEKPTKIPRLEKEDAVANENGSSKLSEEPATRPSEEPAQVAIADVEEKLLVKKLSDKATLPKRGSAGAAGYDLASAEEKVVPARGKALIKTDIAIRVPKGTYGRVAPRSGLASKNFIDTGAGVIDEDYRGNVGVLLFNHSDEDFQVKVGDRVAQLVLERIAVPDVAEVEELDSTERGANGYGSTGVAAK
ncbi:hypothetical protein Agub_g15052 [Astrephomene gubernaculifera]|uniref:Deoxyuridine 5'-triphosphate nucleotidohydrolase n=1 Tax=Astrephomene gubernaculifera TaxID=47775 RepID=A0AAD3E4J4_9CHLO|nr:hypothetical protein Agub_g15052 [Astrephomene gubernaculifera]